MLLFKKAVRIGFCTTVAYHRQHSLHWKPGQQSFSHWCDPWKSADSEVCWHSTASADCLLIWNWKGVKTWGGAGGVNWWHELSLSCGWWLTVNWICMFSVDRHVHMNINCWWSKLLLLLLFFFNLMSDFVCFCKTHLGPRAPLPHGPKHSGFLPSDVMEIFCRSDVSGDWRCLTQKQLL